MQRQCSTWLIQLLSLPRLKSPSLGSWPNYPYADCSVSLVRRNRQQHRVCVTSGSGTRMYLPRQVSIADYRVALQSFSVIALTIVLRRCAWKAVVLRSWLVRNPTANACIIARGSVDRHSTWHLDSEYARLNGFWTLVALESETLTGISSWALLRALRTSKNSGRRE